MRDPSELTVLECRCGERLIIVGPEDDWRSRRAVFGCDRCGQKLTLEDRTPDDHDDEGTLAAS